MYSCIVVHWLRLLPFLFFFSYLIRIEWNVYASSEKSYDLSRFFFFSVGEVDRFLCMLFVWSLFWQASFLFREILEHGRIQRELCIEKTLDRILVGYYGTEGYFLQQQQQLHLFLSFFLGDRLTVESSFSLFVINFVFMMRIDEMGEMGDSCNDRHPG